MCLEMLTSYTVKIKLPLQAGFKTVSELAHSKWHAIDKAYTKYNHIQSDRSKYQAKAPSLAFRRS